MAASGTLSVGGSISDMPTGSRTVGPITMTSAAASGVVIHVILQSGANTITLPTAIAPSMAIIKLPATNTALTTLKGVSGDTGIVIGKTGFAVLPFNSAAPPTDFVLSSAATQTGLTTEITFI